MIRARQSFVALIALSLLLGGCSAGVFSQLAPGANPPGKSATPTPKPSGTPGPTATPAAGGAGGLSIPPQFTYYTGPAGSSPSNITAGPDGNLWFTDNGLNSIGRITPAGVTTEFALPGTGGNAFGIAPGPGSQLWYADYVNNCIESISTAGTITAYPSIGGALNADPESVVEGSDGNLWFAEFVDNAIGKMTTQVPASASFFTTFNVAGTPHSSFSSALGTDGNVWFADTAGNSIDKVTVNGVFTVYPLAANETPFGIAAGPDGNLWFTATQGNAVGSITTSGTITMYPVPTTNAGVQMIASGPDGDLWFTELTSAKLGRITTTGTISEYPEPNGRMYDVTAGPGGYLWGTVTNGNIVKVLP